jgi:hypothetical protein
MKRGLQGQTRAQRQDDFTDNSLLVYKTLDGWLTYLLWLVLKNFLTRCCRLLQILAIGYFFWGVERGRWNFRTLFCATMVQTTVS